MTNSKKVWFDYPKNKPEISNRKSRKKKYYYVQMKREWYKGFAFKCWYNGRYFLCDGIECVIDDVTKFCQAPRNGKHEVKV